MTVLAPCIQRGDGAGLQPLSFGQRSASQSNQRDKSATHSLIRRTVVDTIVRPDGVGNSKSELPMGMSSSADWMLTRSESIRA